MSIAGCYSLDKGVEYLGDANRTIDGIPCQRWCSQTPHSHEYTIPNKSWDDTIEEAGSLCRTPKTASVGYELWPWGFTLYPAIRWAYCYKEGYCSKCPNSCLHDILNACMYQLQILMFFHSMTRSTWPQKLDWYTLGKKGCYTPIKDNKTNVDRTFVFPLGWNWHDMDPWLFPNEIRHYLG